MIEKSRAYPLLGELIKRSWLSWYWTTAIVAAVLLLFLIVSVILDGMTGDLRRLPFWQQNLSGPVLTTYMLVVYPFMWRLQGQAIQALKPLLPLKEDAFNRLVTDVSKPNRPWECAAMLIGVAFAVGLGGPWNLEWSRYFWLNLYLIVTTLLFYCLLAWLIYDTFAGIRRLARLSRHGLQLDIFDTGTLTSIAVWSLGISLVFVGGISLSLVFQTRDGLLRWEAITTYAILICVTVLIFLLSMWSAHGIMVEAKKRELVLARKHLAAASQELRARMSQGQMEGMQEIYSTITSWATYQGLVRETTTWPFNAAIIRRLMVSILVPVTVFLIKVFSRLGLHW
jgi:hypothetical protein